MLDSCGSNIDEAIKLLGALQLSKAHGVASVSSATREGKLETSSAELQQQLDQRESKLSSQTQSQGRTQDAFFLYFSI